LSMLRLSMPRQGRSIAPGRPQAYFRSFCGGVAASSNLAAKPAD